MNWKKTLTPKETEEVRPGLFVQKKQDDSYRVVNPICWNGEWRWKKQFSWKNLITIIIILALAYSYQQETSFCRELNEDPCDLLTNITMYCNEKYQFETYEKEGDTVFIQSYP